MVAVCLAVKAEEVQAVLKDRDGAAWLCCLHLVTGVLGMSSTSPAFTRREGACELFVTETEANQRSSCLKELF